MRDTQSKISLYNFSETQFLRKIYWKSYRLTIFRTNNMNKKRKNGQKENTKWKIQDIFLTLSWGAWVGGTLPTSLPKQQILSQE